MNVLKDVSDRVATSVQKLDGIGQKVTDGPSTAGTNESDGNGPGDSGSQQSDAA